MITVYVYILDTLADWEMGYAAAELNSKRFSKRMRRIYRSKQSVSQKSLSRQWAASLSFLIAPSAILR